MGMRNTVRAAALVAALAAAPAAAQQHEMQALDANAKIAKPAATAAEVPIQGSVARAQFTSAVIDREPTDAVRQLSNDQHRVFFFTEVHNYQDQELVHRWEHAGEVMAEVPFGVAGPRWRVYSSKSLEASWLGKWTVSVVDPEGDVAASESFEYVEAPAPLASEDPPAPTHPGPASLGQVEAIDRGASGLESH